MKVLTSPRSTEGREFEEAGDFCILDGEVGLLFLMGRSGVLGLVCWKSKENPVLSGRTLSDFEVDCLPRLGGGEGTSNERSVMAVMGGVLGNIGSCHSKWGAEMPWNTAEFRETNLPLGNENLA
jgi:hypothetical protein